MHLLPGWTEFSTPFYSGYFARWGVSERVKLIHHRLVARSDSINDEGWELLRNLHQRFCVWPVVLSFFLGLLINLSALNYAGSAVGPIERRTAPQWAPDRPLVPVP